MYAKLKTVASSRGEARQPEPALPGKLRRTRTVLNQGEKNVKTNYYVVTSKAGPLRDLSKGSREQRHWDAHAEHFDRLVDGGVIMMGGPFDDGGAMLIVRAESEQDVRQMLSPDPWYQHGLLLLESIRRWDIFIDKGRKETETLHLDHSR